jgi:uncharacterized protein (TIGR02117 family)
MKKWTRLLGRTLGVLVGAVMLYFVLAWVLSSLPTTSTRKKQAQDVAIWVRTDGFHTEIILPTQNEQKDWSEHIHFASKPPYLAFGWGDRGFYLGTPDASDFQVSLAFKALFYLGTSVVHLTYYNELTENKQCKRLWLSAQAYKKLVQFIEDAFATDGVGKPIPILQHTYGKRHLFFEARGRYSLFYTCNTWVGSALKACDKQTCIWTPFASGIFYFL